MEELKMLKTQNFQTTRDLCKFVNENNIEKNDILSVFAKEGVIYLLFWN